MEKNHSIEIVSRSTGREVPQYSYESGDEGCGQTDMASPLFSHLANEFVRINYRNCI